MFGWLLGKGSKGKKAEKKHPSAGVRSSAHAAALDSVLPDFEQDGDQHVKTVLEEAADRAMQQRREQRKADRMSRREALFGIVREAMLRSGILSSAYKFKVLSIDQKGRHFLVLLDLSMELAASEPAERLLEIEKMIADTAMSRMQVVVQSVYWRHFVPGQVAAVHLSSGDTQPGGLSASIGMGVDSQAPSRTSDMAAKASAKPAEKGFENSAADAISAALAELRAKNRAKVQERAAEQQVQQAVPAPQALAQGADAASIFAATQVIQRAQFGAMDALGNAAAAREGQTAFVETQMQSHLVGQADDDELAAFQRALQGAAALDAPASIFVSGRALEGLREGGTAEAEEPFSDAGIDLSGTQYGELPKF